jgi:hypothetical protein
MPWRRQFAAPLVLNDGRRIVTLGDAAKLFVSFAPDNREALDWRAALNAIFTPGGCRPSRSRLKRLAAES